jgi:hypothetical protein
MAYSCSHGQSQVGIDFATYSAPSTTWHPTVNLEEPDRTPGALLRIRFRLQFGHHAVDILQARMIYRLARSGSWNVREFLRLAGQTEYALQTSGFWIS